MKFEYCATTDRGLVREKNEDNLVVLPEARIFVVADGMGGHVGGEVASFTTVDTIRKYYETLDSLEEDKSTGAESVKEALGLRTKGEAHLFEAIEQANMAVYEEGLLLDPVHGVGTTIAAGYLHGSTMFILYSGDSRVYRLRQGRLKQITEDHSLLNKYLKEKKISAKEAEYFPYKNVILQALGLTPNCQAEVRRVRVQPGDLYLFCTDGLTDMVHDRDIQDALNNINDINEQCSTLVDMALAAGGMDNITVLIVRILGDLDDTDNH